MRIVELSEAQKTEKVAAERNIESLKREKESEIGRIVVDLSQLRKELSKAEEYNLQLLQELNSLKSLREKHDDLKAEWLTL